ncbi:MAG: hypothetical protein HOV83_22960 [Catenulispora sp.]|nr:hypothetical protein [Catenulispora sp.]
MATSKVLLQLGVTIADPGLNLHRGYAIRATAAARPAHRRPLAYATAAVRQPHRRPLAAEWPCALDGAACDDHRERHKEVHRCAHWACWAA